MGAEYRLANLSMLATIQQDLSRAPISYGPSFGFALAIRLPELPSGEPPKPKPDPWAPRSDSARRDAELPDDPW
jgi:hypothetical protein